MAFIYCYIHCVFLCVCGMWIVISFSFSIAFVDGDYRLHFSILIAIWIAFICVEYRLCLLFACIVCSNRWRSSNALFIPFFVCVWNVNWHIIFNCVCRLRLLIAFSILIAIWIAFLCCDIDCVCRLRVSFAVIDGVYLMLYPIRFLCVLGMLIGISFSFSIAFVDYDYRLRLRFWLR